MHSLRQGTASGARRSSRLRRPRRHVSRYSRLGPLRKVRDSAERSYCLSTRGRAGQGPSASLFRLCGAGSADRGRTLGRTGSAVPRGSEGRHRYAYQLAGHIEDAWNSGGPRAPSGSIAAPRIARPGQGTPSEAGAPMLTGGSAGPGGVARALRRSPSERVVGRDTDSIRQPRPRILLYRAHARGGRPVSSRAGSGIPLAASSRLRKCVRWRSNATPKVASLIGVVEIHGRPPKSREHGSTDVYRGEPHRALAVIGSRRFVGESRAGRCLQGDSGPFLERRPGRTPALTSPSRASRSSMPRGEVRVPSGDAAPGCDGGSRGGRRGTPQVAVSTVRRGKGGRPFQVSGKTDPDKSRRSRPWWSRRADRRVGREVPLARW